MDPQLKAQLIVNYENQLANSYPHGPRYVLSEDIVYGNVLKHDFGTYYDVDNEEETKQAFYIEMRKPYKN